MGSLIVVLRCWTRTWAYRQALIGLQYVDIGSPLPATAHRAKGYDVSLVAVLDKPEDALVYAEHPAHEA